MSSSRRKRHRRKSKYIQLKPRPVPPGMKPMTSKYIGTIKRILRGLSGEPREIHYQISGNMEAYYDSDSNLRGVQIKDLPHIQLEHPVDRYVVVELDEYDRVYGLRPPVYKKLLHKYSTMIMQPIIRVIVKRVSI